MAVSRSPFLYRASPEMGVCLHVIHLGFERPPEGLDGGVHVSFFGM